MTIRVDPRLSASPSSPNVRTCAALADRRMAALLALASFALYAATAAPSVATVFDDSLEFQVVAPTLGIAHPSGYPLYTLLGKLATLLMPFRDAAGRLNLLSALAAGATVGILYLVARKLAGSRLAAVVASAAFAISPAWCRKPTSPRSTRCTGCCLCRRSMACCDGRRA